MKKKEAGIYAILFLILVFTLNNGAVRKVRLMHKCVRTGCLKQRELGDTYYCTEHEKESRSRPILSRPVSKDERLREAYEELKQRQKASSGSSGSGSSSGSTYRSGTSAGSRGYSYKSYHSYDDGYDDIYDNDEYDEDRYRSDSDYARGVDDAMDELDW